MNIKPLDAIAKKWAARASGAQADYQAGVQATTKSWMQATENAANSWASGVQAAVASGRFASGVAAAGDQAWKNGVLQKGANRYAQGVQGAQPKFSAGFTKFATALANATLPPRFAKGDPNNLARVNFVTTLLRNTKLGK